MTKNLICINCPRGCNLEVDTETLTVKGNSCIKGKDYGISEVTHQKRIVTSTIPVLNSKKILVSVKTSSPINKEDIFNVIKEINKKKVSAPIKIGDILISNVCNSGINIVATSNAEEK